MNRVESFINPETLTSFKETYSLITPIWAGDPEAHDLYVVWKKMKDDCGPLPSSNRSTLPPLPPSEIHQPSGSHQIENSSIPQNTLPSPTKPLEETPIT